VVYHQSSSAAWVRGARREKESARVRVRRKLKGKMFLIIVVTFFDKY
jgi:hypothetical protein